MTREILITPVLNGFLCKVGCQKVVFQSISALIVGLDEYLHNPEATEKKYIRDAVNKMTPDVPQMEACDSVSDMPITRNLYPDAARPMGDEPCNSVSPLRSTRISA